MQGEARPARAHPAFRLCLDPAHPDLWDELAQGCVPTSALKFVERALLVLPINAGSLNNRGVIRERLGLLDKALEDHVKAVEIDPMMAAGWVNLGKCLILSGRVEEGALVLARALALRPDDCGAMINLSTALIQRDSLALAFDWSHRACSTLPSNALAWNALGLAARHMGQAAQAFEAFAIAVHLAPGSLPILSNLILTGNYLPHGTIDERALLQTFSRCFPHHPRPNPVDPDPHRILRIGYLSADFARHPVGYFMVATIEGHDPGQVAPILLFSRARADDMTRRMARAAPLHEVAALDDAALAELIDRLKIDILVDLSGHGAGNRLGLLARRPAPLQMSWGGCFGSTGLPMVDMLIGDAVHIPKALEANYVERIGRIDPDYVSYAPPEPCPGVSPLPALGSGQFTFGCFNNLLKLNDEVFDLWAAILLQKPRSRLFLKGLGFNEPRVSRRILLAFEARAIDSTRLLLEGPGAHEDILASYGRVDLALDPFPYSGGLTTIEALWMGVPVVTMPGVRFSSRHTASHLAAIGLTQFIVGNADDYSACALHWSEDLDRLSVLRFSLRKRVADSALLDGRSVARQVEAIYRAEWHRLVCQ